jgi:hypothetical protein
MPDSQSANNRIETIFRDQCARQTQLRLTSWETCNRRPRLSQRLT